MTLATVAATGALAAQPAAAVEIRIGLAAHNVKIWTAEHQSDEGGVNVELEAVAGSPQALRRLWRPRPYAMASINTQGDTSFAAAGLYWRWGFAERWALEPGLGLAVHDGATSNPYGPGDPRAAIYEDEHQMLGARVLFRDTLALERRLGERRAISLVVEHLSNGGALFGHDSNQSLNEITLRYAVTFD